MEIVKLEKEHIVEATKLALENYVEESRRVNALPKMNYIPDLSCFAENEFGVAAFDGDKMLGFIGCFNPWDGAFDSNARGSFTPIHAHGCVTENRDKIYQRMYQKMAETLVNNGVLYHGIALYEHDEDAISSYFNNGFGHRCVDAIRKMETIQDVKCVTGVDFEEISVREAKLVRELRRELKNHMSQSSCFMYQTPDEFENWVKERENNGSCIFVAKEQEKIIAFIEISDDAENFVTEIPEMKNICGAYCLPQYRGRMIVQNLLNYVIGVLQKEGYKYLGVDYESFNPTAYHFWRKYFVPYTCSVTRRIDEGIMRKE